MNAPRTATGSERLSGAVSGARPSSGQDQGSDVADTLRGGLPPQPSHRPPRREAPEHSCLQLGHPQAGRLWAGADLWLQRPPNLHGRFKRNLADELATKFEPWRPLSIKKIQHLIVFYSADVHMYIHTNYFNAVLALHPRNLPPVQSIGNFSNCKHRRHL